jgi:hypothetical protein
MKMSLPVLALRLYRQNTMNFRQQSSMTKQNLTTDPKET